MTLLIPLRWLRSYLNCLLFDRHGSPAPSRVSSSSRASTTSSTNRGFSFPSSSSSSSAPSGQRSRAASPSTPGSAVRAPSPGSGSMNRDNDVSRYDFLSVYLHRHKSIFLLAFCLIHYLVLYYDQVISSGIEQHLYTKSPKKELFWVRIRAAGWKCLSSCVWYVLK